MDPGPASVRVLIFQKPMRRIIFYGLTLAVLILVLPGCGKQDLNKPPKIRYGQDICADCRMIIAEPRFAAAAVSETGEVFKFDDIGCAARYADSAKVVPARLWVHDFLTEQWVDGKAAVFVHSGNLVTPMGYGLAAFSGLEDADKFNEKEKGQSVSWEEMPGIPRDKNQSIKGGA